MTVTFKNNIEDGDASHMLVISSDGRHGYTANVGPGTVSVLDLNENTKKVAEFRKCTTIGHRVEDRIDAETLEQLKALRAGLDGRNPG